MLKMEINGFMKEAVYNIANMILSITFTNGKVYDYHNVPLTVFEGFEAAESRSKYFNSSIRNVYNVA